MKLTKQQLEIKKIKARIRRFNRLLRTLHHKSEGFKRALKNVDSLTDKLNKLVVS